MKILLVHNYYQLTGGEEKVFQQEQDLLESHGCIVDIFSVDNAKITGFWEKTSAFLNVVYSHSAKNNLAEYISVSKPDIVHIHNFFPLLTPSIYDACRMAGVPVVQTLHNFRTICPGALLMRDGKICELCVTGSAYQGALFGCYRNSQLGTLMVSRMVEYHRKKRTWHNKVERFIALTDFARHKFVEGGLPAEKLVVKPNFYSSKNKYNKSEMKRNGALFIGRLSREKGIATLLHAWQQLDVPLRVAGDGPLHDTVIKSKGTNVFPLGKLNSYQVSKEMSQAAFLVMTSECYESFPLTLAEAFAHCLPVVASRLGAMAEIVKDSVTGIHFEPGNAIDLADKVRWMHNHPAECQQMGENARREYEEKYTPDRNYEMLENIYHQAIDEKKANSERENSKK